MAKQGQSTTKAMPSRTMRETGELPIDARGQYADGDGDASTEHAGEYHIHLHINTSADEQDDNGNESLHPIFGPGVLHVRQPTRPSSPSTSSSASGMQTPPARPCHIDALLREVEVHLSSMMMQGDDLIAQMHGQELRRWAASFQDEPLATYGRMLADAAAEYVVPGFDIGIAYPANEGRWMASVLARVRHIAQDAQRNECVPDVNLQFQDATAEDDGDAVNLMGGRPYPGRGAGQSRCDERSRDRARRRSRSRSRKDRSGRERSTRNDRDSTEGRDRHARSSRSSAAAGSAREAPEARENANPAPCRERFTQSTRRLVPPQPSRTEAEESGLSTRQQALSFNRLTWRTLLGIEDDGPCQDIHRWVPQPLDEVQADNIAATVQDLGDAERLAMTTGFFRYLLELAHQTMQILVTGQPGDPRRQFNHEEFDDDIVLMQTELKMVQQARDQFREVQAALETCPGDRRYRAAGLKNMIESRYLGVLTYELWHTSIQELHSVLVVLADDLDLMTCDEMQTDDKTFAEEWWKKARRHILQIDNANPMLHGTHLVRSRSPTPDHNVVDLDTPPFGDPRAEEEEEHQFQEHLSSVREEEHRIAQLVAQYENDLDEEKRLIHLCEEEEQRQKAINEARQYQAWEDWVMREALNEPAQKRSRCNILVSASTASSSSSAQLHLELPQPGERIAISVVVHAEEGPLLTPPMPILPEASSTRTITDAATGSTVGSDKRVTHEPAATVEENEDVSGPTDTDTTCMMQTSRPVHATTPARTLLNSLSPQLRQRVVQLLRHNVGRLQQTLREQLRALDDCTTGAPVMEVNTTSNEDSPMLEGLSGVLRALLEQQLGQPPMAAHSVMTQHSPHTAASRPPLPDLREQDEMDVQRRRRTATSSITGDAEILASARLNTTCDTLDHRLDLLLLETNPEQRHGILRSLVHQLLVHLHGSSCRMRILLQIIARRRSHKHAN